MTETLMLSSICNIVKQTPQQFVGYKEYIATGDLQNSEIISSIEVTYQNRPSRADCTVNSGDVLFAKMAGTEKTLIAEKKHEDMLFSTGFAVLRPIPEVLDSAYLYHVLRSKKFLSEKDRLSSGATQKAITNKALLKMKISIPPINEQKRIAAILDKANQINENTTKAQNIRDEIIRSSFLEIFGDPATNPKGWNKRKLGDVTIITTGNTPPRKQVQNYGDHIEWIKSDNINTPSHYLTQATEYLSEEGLLIGRSAEKGSTLMTCIAGSPSCIGNVAIADREVAFNQQINALTPTPVVNPYFLYVLLLVSKRLIQGASTNSMKGMVSKGKLAEIALPIPPIDMQNDFSIIVKSVNSLPEVQNLAENNLLSITQGMLT